MVSKKKNLAHLLEKVSNIEEESKNIAVEPKEKQAIWTGFCLSL